MVSFDLYLSSGLVDAVHYTNGDNVSLVQISQSDQEYYQTGTIIVYNTPSSQNIGDTVQVFIDNSLEFDGYISNRQRLLKGVVEDTYQLVGRTYDLWRYHTNSDTSYSNKTTAYVASSLVATFCTGVSGTNIDNAAGVNINGDIEFSNEIVGDALVRLSKMDGYRFYVDNDGNLVYEAPSEAINMLNVKESDIVDMQPIEESDEDLVNDVLVVGGSGYSTKSTQLLHDSSQCVLDNILYAQRFRAEDPTLSAVKMYLNRTLDPYQPDALAFEIWENTEKTLFTDTFDSWDYLLSGNSNHWNMLIEDGYLQLGAGKYTQSFTPTPEAPHSMYYMGNTFEFNTDVIAYKAGIWCQSQDLCSGWIEIRPTGATGKPTSTVLCSGTINFTNDDYNYWESLLNPQSQLNANIRYAVIIHSDGQEYITVWRSRLETYKSGAMCYSTDDSTWYLYADDGDFGDIGFYVEGKSGYATSGCIESICYSGQYTNEQSGYDCQYMKLDLSTMVSSNYISISGSHDSGGNWSTLYDNTWNDFGSENNAVKVKYIFSSNGNFTPKIGTAELNISDTSAGFEKTVFIDTFENTTYLSSNSISNLWITDGWENSFDSNIANSALMISGLKLRDIEATDTKSYDTDWDSGDTNIFDNNDTTYALIDNIWSDTDLTDYILFNDKPLSLVGLKIKFDLLGDGVLDDLWIQISSNTDTWATIFNAPISWIARRAGATAYSKFDNSLYYSGCMGVRSYFNNLDNSGGSPGKLQYYDFRQVTMLNKGFTAGTAKSIDYDLGSETYYYIKLDVVEYLSDYITYSGSLDSGSSWTKLTKNTNTLINNPGSHLVIMYNIQPSGNFGSVSGNLKYPNIDSVTAVASTVQGGGIPKSGTMVEWSDDVGFTKDEIPYPPSYSAWNTYADPKLRLTDGEYYWMILEHASGSNEYWKFHYDPDSTYGYGGMAMSWDDGYQWSTNATCPTHVPDGDMCFQLGWTQGAITATASDQDSIDSFGRHFKKITDSNITTLEEAQARADFEISGMLTTPKKGTLTINGTTDVDLSYQLSGSFTNFGISEKMDIVSFTQTIDSRGFLTEITYGRQMFDLAKEVAELKREMS